jgi:hypothetical protein
MALLVVVKGPLLWPLEKNKKIKKGGVPDTPANKRTRRAMALLVIVKGPSLWLLEKKNKLKRWAHLIPQRTTDKKGDGPFFVFEMVSKR